MPFASPFWINGEWRKQNEVGIEDFICTGYPDPDRVRLALHGASLLFRVPLWTDGIHRCPAGAGRAGYILGTKRSYPAGDGLSCQPHGTSNGSGVAALQGAGVKVLDSGWNLWVKTAVPESELSALIF